MENNLFFKLFLYIIAILVICYFIIVYGLCIDNGAEEKPNYIPSFVNETEFIENWRQENNVSNINWNSSFFNQIRERICIT